MCEQYRSNVVSVVIGMVSLVLISGCAMSESGQHSPRYLGYRETVTQGGKLLAPPASQLTEQTRVAAAAELFSKTHSKQSMATVLQLAGPKQVLIRRTFISGSFEENFGHEAEIAFSIQPCNRVGREANGVPVCGDQPVAMPTVITRRITLVGGEKLAIQFPEGVEWTYQVLDQASPIVAN